MENESEEPLSIGDARYILGDIVEGTVNPEGARRLLADVLRYLEGVGHSAGALSDTHVEYLAISIRRYLTGSAPSLDKAFGVARPRARPKFQIDSHLEIAAQVIHRMNSGVSQEQATSEVANVAHKTQGQIKKIYLANREDGLATMTAVLLERKANKQGSGKAVLASATSKRKHKKQAPLISD